MKKNIMLRTLAVALTLLIGLGIPARASGLFDWLFGEPEPTAVPAMAEAPQAVTLPPADALAVTDVPKATLAPVPTAEIEDDGRLRVLLRSLDGPKQLGLTLAGVYALEGDPGFRFDRDARVTLSAVENSVYLAVSGLTIDMGPALTLTRHRAEDGMENGIYIDEAEKRTLYCGDLSVTAEGEGLRAVLTLPVEDYLYGVVAYEMSDSFPLEALKAQAVAARTYALQRKWAAGKKDYDVVDTTADQVFKGYDPEYQNVVRAVDETRGVVGLYDGGFAMCYYTASNGGQVAQPGQLWENSVGDDYIDMKDDPYDLENPRSLVNELTVDADCGNCPELKEMLERALGEAMAVEGWDVGEWALDSIAGIEPVNPRFAGSRMCDGLQFSLRVRLLAPVATPRPTDTPWPTETPAATEGPAPDDSAKPVEAESAGASAMPTAPDEALPAPTEIPREWTLSDEPREVVLDVYSQIKDGLSLGLNGSDVELIDVKPVAGADGAATAFTIAMRRFGHGVGMSQRGAQWMAGHYDMNWQEILAFYYPGLSFERMAWPDDALTDLAALPASVGAARPRPTPTPTPVPLPTPRAGEVVARVLASSLNVRERPTTASRAVDQLPRGREVLVGSEPDADGWVAIRTGELEGFVKAEYLEYKGK